MTLQIMNTRSIKISTSTALLGLAFSFLLGTNATAQQHPSLDNYLFSPVQLSPAHAGMQTTDIVSLLDAQWVGVDGAPRTGLLSYDYSTTRGLGFNVSILNDQVGPVVTNQFGLSAAYHLPLGPEGTLSTGLRLNVGQTTVGLIDERYNDLLDAMIYDLQGPMMLNVDLGITYEYSGFYTGFAYKNANRGALYNSTLAAQTLQVFAGGTVKLGEHMDLKPSTVVNFTGNAPADLNLNMAIRHAKTWSFGVHYSPADETGFFLQTQTKEAWNAFYQYNFPLTELLYVTNTSHVIGVGINLQSKVHNVESPRYFL